MVPNINVAGSTLTFVMTLTQFEYLISSFSKRGETANTIHVCAHVLTGHYFDRQPRALVCISFPSTSTSRLLFMVCMDCHLIVPGYLISQHLSLFINKHDSLTRLSSRERLVKTIFFNLNDYSEQILLCTRREASCLSMNSSRNVCDFLNFVL